jgi:hypothetical protein
MHIAKVLLAKMLYESHKSNNQCDNHSCMTCKYENFDSKEYPCSMCYGIIPSQTHLCFWKPQK